MTEVREKRPRELVVGLVAMFLYVPVGVFYFGSGLVMPFWAAAILWVIWIAGLLVLARVYRSRPMWTWVVPVAAMVLWVAVVSLGDWLLGWTA
jgi:hypothetical protein